MVAQTRQRRGARAGPGALPSMLTDILNGKQTNLAHTDLEQSAFCPKAQGMYGVESSPKLNIPKTSLLGQDSLALLCQLIAF